MNDLRDALLLDVLVVSGCLAVLLRRGDARLSHPGVLYVALHAYVVSFRGWSILGGAPTFLMVESASVAKAVLAADLFIVFATLGWASVRSSSPPADREFPSVSVEVARRVALICVPIGILNLFAVGYVPGVGVGDSVVTTSYQTVAVLWPVLVVLAVIYTRGFTLGLTAFLISYLLVLSVQGHSRFRVVIPLIMALFIYLDRRGWRWPPVRIVAAAMVLIAFFLPLKDIGTAVRAGDASLQSVLDTVGRSSEQALEGTSIEQSLLDQTAITLVLVDQRGEFGLGRSYLPLVTLAVPRPWWPDKPGLGDALLELETPRYPIAQVGGVPGLTGDLYSNFGWLGLFLGGGLLGNLSGRYFARSYRAPRQSVARFTYVLVAACIVQVARDGLASLFIFTIVFSTPWLLIGLISRYGNAQKRIPSKTQQGPQQ